MQVETSSPSHESSCAEARHRLALQLAKQYVAQGDTI
jgi:hypothetical protein